MYKKFAYCLFFLSLFLMPIVSSYDFSWQTSFEVTSDNVWDTTALPNRVKAWQHKASGDWFVAFVTDYSSPDEVLEIRNYSSDLSTKKQTLSSQNCGDRCYYADCNILDLNGFENIIECIAWETNGQRNAVAYRYFVDNQSTHAFPTSTNVASTAVLDGQSVVNSYIGSVAGNDGALKMWFKGSAEANPRYTVENDPEDTFAGDGSITLPSSYQDPSDMQLVYCNGFYYIVVNKLSGSNQVITALSYNYDSDGVPQEYQYATSLTPTDWSVDVNDFGVSYDPDDEVMNVVMLNDSAEIPQINLAKWSCNSDGTLSNIFTETLNQTEFESTANSTAGIVMERPFYINFRNSSNDLLIYQWDNAGTKSIRASIDQSGCEDCSDWIVEDECLYEKQKHVRWCPEGSSCTNTTDWRETDYCANEYNRTQGIFEQKYYTYSKDLDCEVPDPEISQGVVPPTTLECKFKEDIPAKCQNISVSIEAFPRWVKAGIGCNEGNWSLKVCNPDKSSSCDEEITACDNLNTTLNKTYFDYLAGETASAGAYMYVESSCKCYLANIFGLEIIPIGITNYGMGANFKLSCDLPYESSWECDENGEYERLQRTDGSYTNETYCDYGCNEITGRCKNSAGESDVDRTFDTNKILSMPTKIFRYILDLFIRPNEQKLELWGWIIVLVGGIIGFKIFGDGKEWQNGVVFGLGGAGIGFVISLGIGLFPLIWGVIIIIIAGLGFLVAHLMK